MVRMMKKKMAKQLMFTKGLKVKSLSAFFELVRFEHAILFSIGVIIGVILAGGEIFTPNMLLGLVTVICIEMSTFAMNDYFDYPADKVNRRYDRPLVRGDISKNIAALTAIVALPLGNICAFIASLSSNIYVFLIPLIISLLSVIYNVFLKKTPLVGNIFIGITMAIPFIFGAAIADSSVPLSVPLAVPLLSIPEAVLFLSAIAFVVGVGREIMKDAEDIKGDIKSGGYTLPTLMGLRGSLYVVIAFYLIAVFLSIIPFFTFFSGKIQYSIILITDLILLIVSVRLLRDVRLSTLRWSRKWTLYAITIGLIAFLLTSM
jgi:geranylgeranylglycerol-phosphate geranylgeranyltransferase